MSTKIYDGMIAMQENVFDTADSVRSVIEPWYIDKCRAAVEKVMAHPGENYAEIFGGALGLPKTLRERWSKVEADGDIWNAIDNVLKMVEELRKFPMRTMSDMDFAVEVLIIPNGRGNEFQPLVLLFCETDGPELRKALRKKRVVRDYSYWDNSDRDSNISEEEWLEREKAWSVLDAKTPAEAGVSIRPTDTTIRMALMSMRGAV